MRFQTTLNYSAPVLKHAVFTYWRRLLGIGYFISILTLVAAFVVLLVKGDHSYLLAALAIVLLLGIVMPCALYRYQYKTTMNAFRAMDEPSATFIVEDETFTTISGVNTSTLQWSYVRELWLLPDAWLMFYSKAQFSTLPIKDIPEEMQSFIVQQIKSAGGKIVR